MFFNHFERGQILKNMKKGFKQTKINEKGDNSSK